MELTASPATVLWQLGQGFAGHRCRVASVSSWPRAAPGRVGSPSRQGWIKGPDSTRGRAGFLLLPVHRATGQLVLPGSGLLASALGMATQCSRWQTAMTSHSHQLPGVQGTSRAAVPCPRPWACDFSLQNSVTPWGTCTHQPSPSSTHLCPLLPQNPAW